MISLKFITNVFKRNDKYTFSITNGTADEWPRFQQVSLKYIKDILSLVIIKGEQIHHNEQNSIITNKPAIKWS